MTYFLVPIVEGHAEDRCIERLLHRIWLELLNAPARLQVLRPSRGNRDALINPQHSHLSDKVGEAYLKLTYKLNRESGSHGLLLLLLDAEKDCPAELAPKLLERARTIRSDVRISCVLAKRMLENWIVAGASTLAGVNELPDPLPTRDQFEERSGKAWLDHQIRVRNPRRKYSETVDAKEFVAAMNLAECRTNAPSFDKLCRELEGWLQSNR